MLLADRIRTAKNPSVEIRRTKRALDDGTLTLDDVKQAAVHLIEQGHPDALGLTDVVEQRSKPPEPSKAAEHRLNLRRLNDGAFRGDHIQRAILSVLIDILGVLEKK